MAKEKEDINNNDIKKMLHEFHVNTETELDDELNQSWNKSYCVICGKELDLLTCNFSDGDPVCFGGCRNNF